MAVYLLAEASFEPKQRRKPSRREPVELQGCTYRLSMTAKFAGTTGHQLAPVHQRQFAPRNPRAEL